MRMLLASSILVPMKNEEVRVLKGAWLHKKCLILF